MDFRKVLAAFLAVFIALDIFLGVQWVREYPFSDNRTTDQQILDEMSDDGISYGSLVQNRQSGSYLAGKDGKQVLIDKQNELKPGWQTSFSDGQFVVVPQKPVQLGVDSASDVMYLDKFVAKDNQVIMGNEYQYSKKMTQIARAKDNKHTTSKLYVFVEKIPADNHAFVSDRAQIVFEVDSNHRLQKYEQQYVNQTQFLRDDMQLISEKQALINLYQYNELPNNSTVKLSKIGYAPLTTVKKDIIFIPVWQFLVSTNKDTTLITVNAINGSIMK